MRELGLSITRGCPTTKYGRARAEAYSATESALDDRVHAKFSLTEITADVIDAWENQWKPVTTRKPPNGGWDWGKKCEALSSEPKRFEIAVWNEGRRLSGLAIGKTNRTAVRIDLLEGDPRDDSPLKGKVLAIVLEAAANYAQILKRSQVWVMRPANERLTTLYRDVYGFVVEHSRSGGVYCWRSV